MAKHDSVANAALAKSIAALMADYRAGEIPQTAEDDVLEWADCFDAADRTVLLTETESILKTRYRSHAYAVEFLGQMIKGLAEDIAGGSLDQLLKTTAFLDLQPPGKSQGAMLETLDTILKTHGTSVKKAGGKEPTNFVYLDDILCTGNTLFFDMKKWWEAQTTDGDARSDRFTADQKVHYVFIARHVLQHQKVFYRFKKNGMTRIAPQRIWSGVSVKNDPEDPSSTLDFAYPRVKDLPEEAIAYLAGLDVDPKAVCRRAGKPTQEILFTSPESRNQFETILLKKGLELLDAVSTKKSNIRPLGFTLPSHKNLGFGALVFTWRNVPNNAPLAFWYDAPGFTPLFKKRPAFANFFVLDD